jgi:hypothetical protein
MVLAKSVVKNKFWILRSDDDKVGTVEAEGKGFKVNINGTVNTFRTLKSAKEKIGIDFEAAPTVKTKTPQNHVNGYVTDGKAYNPVIDVRRKIPLFTRQNSSKSWYAAGWYMINQAGHWQPMLCPKKIILDRYPYMGPFHTKEQARESTHS